MELQIMMSIALGLMAVVMFALAEWRISQRRTRVAATVLSILLAATAVWDFKNQEKEWEQHFLLHSTGQSFISIEGMLEKGEQAKVLQLLKKWKGDGSLYHLRRIQLEEIRHELSQN